MSPPTPSEEILASAAFSELGYAGTSTRRIATEARLQQASILRHFPHKADIVSELLGRTVDLASAFSLRPARLRCARR